MRGSKVKDTPSLTSVMDFSVWFALWFLWWIFDCFCLWAPFSCGRTSRKIHEIIHPKSTISREPFGQNPLAEASALRKRGWQKRVRDRQGPKFSKKRFPWMCSPSDLGAQEKRNTKGVWASGTTRKLLLPTASVRQTLLGTSESFSKRRD